MRRLLTNLGCIQHAPTALLCDNQAAICLVQNPKFHNRTKHIEVQYHKIHEEHTRRTICMEYVSTVNQIADILTKPMACDKFEWMNRIFGLTENHIEDKAKTNTLPQVGV